MSLITILCVEDDIDTCELISFSLGLSGYQVEAVHTCEAGLNEAKNRPYDLYGLDYCLPDGNGIALCQQIRRFDLHTPIIFYSGAALPYDIERAMRAGAQAYLVKPLDPVDLTIAVRTLLYKK